MSHVTYLVYCDVRQFTNPTLSGTGQCDIKPFGDLGQTPLPFLAMSEERIKGTKSRQRVAVDRLWAQSLQSVKSLPLSTCSSYSTTSLQKFHKHNNCTTILNLIIFIILVLISMIDGQGPLTCSFLLGLAWSPQHCSTSISTTQPAGDCHPLYSCFSSS